MFDQGTFEFEYTDADAAKFAEHVAAHPDEYRALLRFALEARRAGRTRLSINMLHERVRWYTTVEARDGGFKLNNNWRPFYARLLMQREPDLVGFFELRKSKADEA